MGVWIVKARALSKKGKVFTFDTEFKNRRDIAPFLNRTFDTGDYVSVGASCVWSEKPKPERNDDGTLTIDGVDIRLVQFPKPYVHDWSKVNAEIQSNSHRKPTKSHLYSPYILRPPEINDVCIHCNGTGGVRRQPTGSPEVDSSSVQQAQPVHYSSHNGACTGQLGCVHGLLPIRGIRSAVTETTKPAD